MSREVGDQGHASASEHTSSVGDRRPPETGRVASLWMALREVMDPELPISVVDLGLIYGLRVAAGEVEIDLTYTATGCPCTTFIRDDVRERLLREPGVERVAIREVWSPPWTKARISVEGRDRLRRAGVAV